MSRNLYILAIALVVLSIACLVMSWTFVSHQPDLPGESSMWRMMALALFLLGAFSCLAATLMNMFEQASRRQEDRDRRDSGRRS